MRIHIVLAFAGMTVVTYFSHVLFTVSVSRVRVPPFWERFWSFIPFAVLTAMVTLSSSFRKTVLSFHCPTPGSWPAA